MAATSATHLIFFIAATMLAVVLVGSFAYIINDLNEAMEARGAGLVERLKAADGAIPYLHIFALLSLLKRICDHPALALRRVEDFRLRDGLSSGCAATLSPLPDDNRV